MKMNTADFVPPPAFLRRRAARLLMAAAAFVVLPGLGHGGAVISILGNFDVDNGQNPTTALVFGPDGNLYGTTQTGGSTTENPPFRGCVYTVSPSGGNLHRFQAFSDVRGVAPRAPLIVGSDGNFYGTTSGGNFPGPDGTNVDSYGTIFQLKPDGTLTGLYLFPYDSANDDYPDGNSPVGPLLEINPGVFLGTTVAGGTGNGAAGTLFEYNMNANTLGSLYTFHGTSGGVDQGDAPQARLIDGGNGAYYSTTLSGGPSLLGSIFQATGTAGDVINVYDFTNETGAQPGGGLTLGPDDKLYGTTVLGGTKNYGAWYRISPEDGYEYLGSFDNTDNGQHPYGEPVLATDGNFYGTTSEGGPDGQGTVFRLTTDGKLNTVYNFPNDGSLGIGPRGTLIQGPDGRLYGTTYSGGTGSYGTVFALSLNPVINSATTATATVGKAFSYQIKATNNPTSFDATGLPSGLSVNETTGVISGTPAASATGVKTLTLTAVNGMGKGTATLTLTVNGPPVITSAKTARATVGETFSYQITARNNPTSYNATGLPSGLSVNKTTGVISGTPASTAAGAKTLNLSATNAYGTGTETLTLTVNPPAPVITSATTASATVGQAFSYQIKATNQPTSYGATGLPKGLSVDTGTGVISGTPASTAAGTKTITLKATNVTGAGEETLTLTVKSS